MVSLVTLSFTNNKKTFLLLNNWAPACNIQAETRTEVQLPTWRIIKFNLLLVNIGNWASSILYKIKINRCWNSSYSKYNLVLFPMQMFLSILMPLEVLQHQVVWVFTNKFLRARTAIPFLWVLYPMSWSVQQSRAFTRSKSSFCKIWERIAREQVMFWASSYLVRILPIYICHSICRIHNCKLGSSARLRNQKDKHTYMVIQ